MKAYLGVLVTVAIVVVLVGILWMRHKMVSGANRKRSKREHLQREAERDRRAVQVATRSRSAGNSAPRGDAFTIPEAQPQASAAVPAAGSRPPQSLQQASDTRRRAATSTSFDPDLPSS